VRLRYFIYNTPAAYAAISVLHRPVESAPDAGPEAAYARRLLIEEFGEALAELPEEQRSVFVAHELDGRSFKELAAQTGIALNTLLSRKRYAVLHLRRRLQAIHDEYVEL
jgi:RNA polymerase sigma factor (sigma-70 family)